MSYNYFELSKIYNLRINQDIRQLIQLCKSTSLFLQFGKLLSIPPDTFNIAIHFTCKSLSIEIFSPGRMIAFDRRNH